MPLSLLLCVRRENWSVLEVVLVPPVLDRFCACSWA